MSQKIKIMILGGARENGKNMYAVQEIGRASCRERV